MSGLLLRLAGPLQSWSEHSVFHERDTANFPTASAMVGMFAAALNRKRTDPVNDLAALRFTVRVDRPGVGIVDLQTVGGGLPREQTTPTAEGKRRAHGLGTILSYRHYIADAVFTVAVTGADSTVSKVAGALRAPYWAPYLGRRACPPEEPVLLAGPVDKPEHMLRHDLPLARPRPHGGAKTVGVDFVSDEPSVPGSSRQVELADIPKSFAPHSRSYDSRTLHITTVHMPAELCAGDDYLQRLTDYLQGHPR